MPERVLTLSLLLILACATARPPAPGIPRPEKTELAAHQGETPLVHVRLGDDREGSLDADGAPPPRRPNSSYAFIAFDDGTTAFEPLGCGGPGKLVVRPLAPAQLKRLRAFLAERCPLLPHCDDCARTLYVACAGGDPHASVEHRTSSARPGDGLLAVAQELADQVGFNDLLARHELCPPGEPVRIIDGEPGPEQIELTVKRR